jgi:hypothetical protein
MSDGLEAMWPSRGFFAVSEDPALSIVYPDDGGSRIL